MPESVSAPLLGRGHRGSSLDAVHEGEHCVHAPRRLNPWRRVSERQVSNSSAWPIAARTVLRRGMPAKSPSRTAVSHCSPFHGPSSRHARRAQRARGAPRRLVPGVHVLRARRSRRRGRFPSPSAPATDGCCASQWAVHAANSVSRSGSARPRCDAGRPPGRRSRDGRAAGADRRVQADGRLDDPPAGLVGPFGAALSSYFRFIAHKCTAKLDRACRRL